jgi:hypothetical protein
MSTKINSLEHDLKDLRDTLDQAMKTKGDEIQSLQNDVSTLKSQIELLNDMKDKFIARQIGIDCEEKLLKYIFPKCKTKNFRIRSLAALEKFLTNPKVAIKENMCDRDAEIHWNQMNEADRQAIVERKEDIEELWPLIFGSVRSLKDEFISAHPKCDNYEDVLKHFEKMKDDDDTFDCLIICRSVYEAKSMADLVNSEKSAFKGTDKVRRERFLCCVIM